MAILLLIYRSINLVAIGQLHVRIFERFSYHKYNLIRDYLKRFLWEYIYRLDSTGFNYSSFLCASFRRIDI